MGRPLTVLILSADSLTRRSCENALGIAGYNVITARTGFDALGQIERIKIDVLVTDAELGGEVDGLSVAKSARDHNAKVEVIYTAAAPHRIPDARRVPGAPCIRAPFGPYQVSGVIVALKQRPALAGLAHAA